jgi:hypothetical protein
MYYIKINKILYIKLEINQGFAQFIDEETMSLSVNHGRPYTRKLYSVKLSLKCSTERNIKPLGKFSKYITEVKNCF